MSALSLSGAGAASAEFSGRRGIAPGSDRGSRGGGTGGAAAVAGAAGGTHSSSFGQFGAMASCVHIRLPPSFASALAGHRHMHVLIAGITQAAAQNNLRCQPILTAASGVGHREQCLGSARNGGAGCRPAAAFQRQTIRRDAFPPERQGGGAWWLTRFPALPLLCVIAAASSRPRSGVQLHTTTCHSFHTAHARHRAPLASRIRARGWRLIIRSDVCREVHHLRLAPARQQPPSTTLPSRPGRRCPTLARGRAASGGRARRMSAARLGVCARAGWPWAS